MSKVVIQKSVRVRGINGGRHISHVTSDQVWISDYYNNLTLTNTAGEDLYCVTNMDSGEGAHTVNSDKDLIYIDYECNIRKLSLDNKVKSTLIMYKAPWRPLCLFSSPRTGDLLVVMRNIETFAGKVNRYSSTGDHMQTLQHDTTDQELYSDPLYITENCNGDVIVSDFCRAVVVTDPGGKHRFSYTGHPSGSPISPRGVCTDAMSHILVCDRYLNTIQMIDKDGHFLSIILTLREGIYRPLGLSYDDKTNLLWIGSLNDNTIGIYRCFFGDSLTAVLPKCKYHPRLTTDQFCIPCEAPLCPECTSFEDHRRHNCRDVRKILQEVHEKKGGDEMLMCLLLCQSYKINLKEKYWIQKYNAVAEVFDFLKITKESNPINFQEYSPIIKHTSSEVLFSHEFLRHAVMLRFAENPKYMDTFLTWAEKQNVSEYCRSWACPRKEDEIVCWLLPYQTEKLIEKLGEDIFAHPTMQDQSILGAVFSKVGIPVQIIMRGDKSIRNFIENLKKGRTMMYNASGMIVGCAGSGKSTLLGRLKGMDLEEILEKTKSTRGIEVYSDVFNVSKTITVNSSILRQHFKITFEKDHLVHKFPRRPVKVADESKMRHSEEPTEFKTIAGNADNVEHLSNNSINLKIDLSKRSKTAALVEKKDKEVVDGQNISEDSEIAGVVHFTNEISDDPYKQVTVVDFAGQCAYYASHQIFLSPRAFFILVLNMKNKFDDKVGEEVCSQEGSIFKGWTHRDYLRFWVKSIHQYTSDKAPILLVGTHAEEISEQVFL